METGSVTTLTLNELLDRAGDVELNQFFSTGILQQISTLVNSTELEFPDPVTGNSMKAVIETLPSDNQPAMLNASIEMIGGTEDVDMSEILANLDQSGGKIRPWIASLMAVQLFVSIIVYGILVWKISYEASKLPEWTALVIPIGIPVTIVWSYFGFLKAERRELMEAVMQNTPVGGAVVRFGKALVAAKK